MTLRTKLLLFAALCAIIPIFLSTFWASRIASESIELELRQKSREVLAQAHILTKNKIDSISSYSFLVINNPTLPLAVENKNEFVLKHIARSVQEGLNLDILEIIDGFGELVYSAEEPSAVGKDRLFNPIVQRLHEERHLKKSVSLQGIGQRANGIAIEVATLLPKIPSRAPLQGTTIMGFYLNEKFFKEMKTVMGGEFCLFSKGEIAATTFEVPREKLSAFFKDFISESQWNSVIKGQEWMERVSYAGVSYIFALKKLDLGVGDLQLAIFLSSEKARAARVRTIFYIALTGLIGIGIALILAVILSSRLLTPINAFTRAIDELGQGNLKTKIEVSSRDEIGFLAHTFNTMLSQLKDAQDKLIRTERLAAIGQLASGVGHELRNPLAAIKNALYFIKGALKKNPPSGNVAPVEQMMDLAENEIKATVKISNDLLEFSRAIRVNPVKVEINTLLTSIFKVVTIPETVELQKRFGESLPSAFIDPERMKQVFINLINNAVEAMPNGGVLQIETCYNNNGSVEVFVRDTGCGINQENQGKIFEPLFSTKAKGTGLGLAIVRGIVEAHRGTITLKSAEGQGTEFLVRIPITL